MDTFGLTHTGGLYRQVVVYEYFGLTHTGGLYRQVVVYGYFWIDSHRWPL